MNSFYKIVLCIVLPCFFHATLVKAQVSINNDGSQPHSSAMLDVKSSEKGFLLPRMSYNERNSIPSPAEGLMVFCTDCGINGSLEIYIGGTWKAITIAQGLPPNTAPLAANVGQEGYAFQNFLLTGSYTYSDADGDPEGSSVFKWYRADNNSGLNEVLIQGATEQTYTLSSLDNGKYIRFSVSPVAQVGPSPGSEIKASSFIGPITTFECPASITDPRNGITYNTILIGNQCWMKENINVGNVIDGTQSQSNNSMIEKHCYNNSTANCDIYGGLYQWEEMMDYTPSSNTNPSGRKGICTDNWHIPSFDEWQQLILYLGGGSIAGGELKETGTLHWTAPNTGATNNSDFTALPGGVLASGQFSDLGLFGNFWASLENEAGTAYDLFLSNAYTTATLSTLSKNTSASVRCLKNY